MTTLLLAKHDNHVLNDATSKSLTAALAIGSPVHVLVAGSDAAASPRPRQNSMALKRCFLLTTQAMSIGLPNRSPRSSFRSRTRTNTSLRQGRQRERMLCPVSRRSST